MVNSSALGEPIKWIKLNAGNKLFALLYIDNKLPGADIVTVMATFKETQTLYGSQMSNIDTDFSDFFLY